ncbi:MAG: primosomal protein N' [Calditrichia bacterium]|jgi:primosomal protein N' (replication factor Y)|nr:primosomal protein N' [Calditrichia bacterium]
MTYVDVVFNLSIEKSFTYKVPPEILSEISVGQRVLAPFGKRELTGIVINVTDRDPGIKCKDIIDVLDEKPLISKDMLDLTRWMSEYYLASWGSTLQITLPKGLDRKSNVYVDIIEDENSDLVELTENQRHLYDLIDREPGKTTYYYRKKFGTGSFDYNLRVLEEKYLIDRRKKISAERVRKKLIRNFTVSEDISEKFSGLRKSDELQTLLLPLKGRTLSSNEFSQQTGLSPGRIKTLLKRGILTISESEMYREYFQGYQEKQEKITLNNDQQLVLAEVNKAIRKSSFNVFLLHGVTGSGKTQIYLESIKSVLQQNKSAIVLIPEISLTPQTVGRFKNYFPDLICVFNSRMSLGERYDTWRKVEQSEKCIVIGPRSALFLPVQNPGIIIVDEEHDGSFKQESPAPRYHARDTAIYRARMNDAVVILGSATPSMESYYNAYQGKYHLLKLEKRIENLEMPAVHIINMKTIKTGEEQTRIFSRELLEKIRERIENREQIILLQNRRGFSSYLQCKQCGHTTKCPHCDIYLTFHISSNSLQCHYCGYSMSATNSCPKCDGSQIKYIGAGTQQIERELQRLIPEVRILRMDFDTTSMKNAHENILKRFKDGKADILLGTQMIAKGLDFENVSLVGVISADIGLTLPDFRSAERIFQLLTQVAGRAGRKRKQGEVVIQTRMENHYAIQFARKHDFKGFYAQESVYRKESGYPPFTRLIKIGISSDDVREVNRMARDIVSRLKKYSNGYYTVVGPAPAPVTRLKNKYRWQVLLKVHVQKDRSRKKVRTLLKSALEQPVFSKKGSQTVSIDVDPMDMM